MKGSARLLTALALATLAGPVTGASTTVTTPATSTRSKEVRQRIQPLLEKELAARGLVFGAPLYLRIFKETRELELWMKQGSTYVLFKTWPVSTWGPGTLGPKLKEGDGQAPEGCYTVAARQLNPNSNYHLAMNVGYPNELDRALGRTGSAIMIHGNCVSIGCFAMTDPVIEEIYTLADAALSHGQTAIKVHSFPFRPTAARLAAAAESPWLQLWTDLAAVHDAFEKTHLPPSVHIRDGRYLLPAPQKQKP